VTSGRVKWFSDEEGWGALTSDEVPGEIFVHFSHISGEGYRTLEAGERVQFDWEHYPPGQDGYYYRATRVVHGGG
jgi:cold shock protein